MIFLPIGNVNARGGTVSEVIESRHPGLATGDLVLGYDGSQAYAVSHGVGVRNLDPEQAPISTALGGLGMPVMTAYVGLTDRGASCLKTAAGPKNHGVVAASLAMRSPIARSKAS